MLLPYLHSAPQLSFILEGRQYAHPSSEEPLNTPLSDGLLFAWSAHATENIPTADHVDQLIWDLCRRCGPERGRELFIPIAEAWGGSLSKAKWAAAHGRRQRYSDALIIHELAAIHNRKSLPDHGPLISDDGSVQAEIKALADRFDTLTFELARGAYEPYRLAKNPSFQYLHDGFARLKFGEDYRAGRIPPPSAPREEPTGFKLQLGPKLLGKKGRR